MDEQVYQQLAAQLRQPSGETGIQTGEWMNKGNVHINMDTIETLDAVAGDNILEIGMGNGYFVHHILENDASIKYTGADFSDVMVEESKKINSTWISNGQATFVLCNADKLPFKDNSFNKVFTINTIYFWNDAVKILLEIERVLLPKGKLIITLRPKHLMENYPFTKYGFNMFSREDMVQLIAKSNFTIDKVTEKQEPDFELNGEMVKIESLIIEMIKS